jgi:hypothetical protein
MPFTILNAAIVINKTLFHYALVTVPRRIKISDEPAAHTPQRAIDHAFAQNRPVQMLPDIKRVRIIFVIFRFLRPEIPHNRP